MPAALLTIPPVPGIVHGAYPQQRVVEPSKLDTLERIWLGLRESLRLNRLGRYRRFAARVIALEARYSGLSEAQFSATTSDLRTRLGRQGLDDTVLVDAFAVVREAIHRSLGLRPFATQIIAARIMLDRRLAEMHTGEGKTLAIALAAASAALAGIPVHVITANDYLVTRDAEQLRGVYGLLGLDVGAIVAGLPPDQRRAEYARSITYCTAKELVFDYLRDRMLPRMNGNSLQQRMHQFRDERAAQPLLRGLCLAIIDEADNVLLDEAVTPLILSQPGRSLLEPRHLSQALGIARVMQSQRHYQIDTHQRTAYLSGAGQDLASARSETWGGLWRNTRFRENLTMLALSALHCYQRDRDYLVHEGKIEMIDPTTGRIAAGRQWARGLHQLLELKEGCELSNPNQTLAQITYQRFFPRYLQLGGASATLHEARGELWQLYGLGVVRVPLRRPSRRNDRPPRLFLTRTAKWQAVTSRCRALSAQGRALLIGTDSVADSETLAHVLEQAGLAPVVLNARQDRDEAETVARAGRPGCITVATNMAGRGTDISLTPDVKQRGGLHVINCQLNGSARIDRQLHGRCARQGDPGSTETLLSLEDPLIARYLPAWLRRILARLARQGQAVPHWLARPAIRWPQRLETRRQRALRRRLRARDRQLRRWLAVGGPGE
ncbi:MAG: hypothetical protein ACFCUJ_01955 [Thiotrichales bacterium]